MPKKSEVKEVKALAGKRVSDSATSQIQILMPSDINGYERLFGGKLMEWIDVVAAVVARRHSNCNVTTAAVDHLQFKQAAFVNSTIVLKGHITYVGKSSMEVKVVTYVEELNGERRMINGAYLILVAIDENGRPTQVPELILETDEEKAEHAAAILRKEHRKNTYK